MDEWYDPRESWTPVAGLFIVAFALVIDHSRPASLLGSGLWIPVLYAAVPVTIGVLAYVKTRTSTGLPIPPVAVVGLTVWGVIGAVTALVIVIVIGLGRPPPSEPPSAAFGLLTGMLTYVVPTATFAGLYGEAGRRPRRLAVALVLAAPVVVTIALALLVWVSW